MHWKENVGFSFLDTEDNLDANVVTHELALRTDFENFASESQLKVN